ncbi:hypothetical protein CR513_43520, partial [Mucuna pruriens]
MPTLIYKSLNFGDLEPTRMIIQLANKSVVQPLGILEDVLLQVNELISLADFYVLDMEDEISGKGSTLILGRPFLMIAKTKVDVHAGMLSMEFGDTLVQFNIFEAMKHPTEDHSLFSIDLIDELVEEYYQLDTSNEDISNFAGNIEIFNCLGIDLADLSQEVKLLKLLDQVCKHEDPEYSNNAEVQVVKTKKLLAAQEEEKLLDVLRKYKKAIGWKLYDLSSINPSICMHRILMEEEAQTIRQQQRRLNPTILDVVKKEVTKLLAVGIIYPISDSQWVSLVQVVPKKSRMTATRKDHFPLPFIDQVLEKLVGKSHYCFLDGFFGYMQIHIAPEDQHKMTFTFPFGTFAYTRMSFGLCNALSRFQRCMTSIFLDLL